MPNFSRKIAAAILTPLLLLPAASAEKAATSAPARSAAVDTSKTILTDTIPRLAEQFKAICSGTTFGFQRAKTAELPIPAAAKAKLTHPNVDTIDIKATTMVDGVLPATLSGPQGETAAKNAWTACTGNSATDIKLTPNSYPDGTGALVMKGDKQVGNVSVNSGGMDVDVFGTARYREDLQGTKRQVKCTDKTDLTAVDLAGSAPNALGLPVSNTGALATPSQVRIETKSGLRYVASGKAADAIKTCVPDAKFEAGSYVKKPVHQGSPDPVYARINLESATASSPTSGPLLATRYTNTGRIAEKNGKPYGEGTAWTVTPIRL